MGSWSKFATSVENLFAKSEYSWTYEQLQQLCKMSLAVCAISVTLLFSPAILSTPCYAENTRLYSAATPEYLFHDFEYVKKLWKMKSDELWNEDAKYLKYSEPYLDSLKDRGSLVHVDFYRLKKAPDTEANIARKRGYDIQALYNLWWDEVYMKWWERYQKGYINKTFDELLKSKPHKALGYGVGRLGVDQSMVKIDTYTDAPDCMDKHKYFYKCNGFPDWRTKKHLEQEKTILKKYKDAYKKYHRLEDARLKSVKEINKHFMLGQ
jgi:hypothetical protein